MSRDAARVSACATARALFRGSGAHHFHLQTVWAGYQPAACFPAGLLTDCKKPPGGRLPADSPPHKDAQKTNGKILLGRWQADH